jgi:hypothetical protein
MPSIHQISIIYRLTLDPWRIFRGLRGSFVKGLLSISHHHHYYFSAVGTTTRLRAERYGVWIPAGKINFLSYETSRPTLGPTQPPIQTVYGSVPLEKQPGREIDQSTPSAREVKNGWSCTSAPKICFQSVDEDDVTSTFITSILSKDTSDKTKHVKPPDTNFPTEC